jgi:hypothetical protein
MFNNCFISIFYILSNKIFNFISKSTLSINWTDNWPCIFIKNTICKTNTIILFAKIWCLMNNTCTTLFCYVIITEDTKSCFDLFRKFEINQIRKQTRNIHQRNKEIMEYIAFLSNGIL